jgi:hypothetical protein
MQLICKNCSHKFKGNFCNSCGQSANTHRMDFHTMWHDIQHGVLHIDKGFFYTINQLFSRPGYAIKEFLDGQRLKHFKPIPLLFILAGIYALISHYFHVDFVNDFKISANSESAVKSNLENIKNWFSNNYALASVLGLPIYSIGNYLVFKKTGYNFVEFIVLTAFIQSQQLIVRIVLFPLIYFYNGTSGLKALLFLIGFGLMLWTFSQFFKGYKKTELLYRTLLGLIISFVILFVLLLLGLAVFFTYLEFIT